MTISSTAIAAPTHLDKPFTTGKLSDQNNDARIISLDCGASTNLETAPIRSSIYIVAPYSTHVASCRLVRQDAADRQCGRNAAMLFECSSRRRPLLNVRQSEGSNHRPSAVAAG